MKKKGKYLLGMLLIAAMLTCSCSAEEQNASDNGVNYDLPFYFQWDMRWGNIPYGTGVIGSTGCGPTCMAMVAQYLTDNVDYTPEYIAEYAEELGCYVPGKGTSWALFTDGCTGLNLSGTQITLDSEVMREELRQGHLIILSMGAGEFTNDGHFICVRGFNEEGFLINDPNSPDKTLQAWSGSLLISQAAAGWSFSCIQKQEIRFDLLPGLDEDLIKTLMEQEG